MRKTKMNIAIVTPYDVSLEGQVEMLAYIRQSLGNFSNVFPEAAIMVGRVPNEEEIMDALRTNSQSREQCMHYDEAQGRHRCFCQTRKSSKCEGVCKDYKPIKK